jgi:hypothetical protein
LATSSVIWKVPTVLWRLTSCPTHCTTSCSTIVISVASKPCFSVHKYDVERLNAVWFCVPLMVDGNFFAELDPARQGSRTGHDELQRNGLACSTEQDKQPLHILSQQRRLIADDMFSFWPLFCPSQPFCVQIL